MKTRFWACLFLFLSLLCLWGLFSARPALSGGDLEELSDAVTAALLRTDPARAVFGIREENEILL